MLTLKELLKERVDDVAALNLKAAVELAEGNAKAAEETLHSSIRSNPRSHYAYYNLARLILEEEKLKVEEALQKVAQLFLCLYPCKNNQLHTLLSPALNFLIIIH